MPDNDDTSTKRYHYYNDETSTKCNHCCNDNISMKKVLVCVFSIIFGSAPVAVTVFGITDYYQCPKYTMFAIYMIAQGATSVFIPILASWWCCCHCISGKFIISCCVIIGLFNFFWGIYGTILLLFGEYCNGAWDHDIVFIIILWILFGLLLLTCYCYMACCCTRDD